MKKITTLFKKDPNDLGRVINELSPENAWVLTSGIATRKYDGTACAIINGMLYKRYDAKINKRLESGNLHPLTQSLAKSLTILQDTNHFGHQ